MLRLVLLFIIYSVAFTANSQTFIYKAFKLTECIISNEEFKSMNDIMDIDKIKSYDDERQIVSRDSISDFQITFSINESARSGRISFEGEGNVERTDIIILEVEELSNETKRYKYIEERFKEEEYKEFMLVHDEKGTSEDFILLYSEEEVREEYDDVVMFIILEDIGIAKLK